MTGLERGILAGTTALLLGLLPGGIYLFGVRPVNVSIQTMKRELDRALEERNSSNETLQKQQVEWDQLREEMGRLYLFDLRTDKNFETTINNRSNIGLIALSEILQKNGVAIDSLEPQAAENTAINVAGAPQGGISRRKYLIKATGRYKNLLAAFSDMKTLPPTLEVNGYDVAYVGEESQQARMEVALALSFNFLLTPEQLSQAQASGSAQPNQTSWRPSVNAVLGSVIEAIPHSGNALSEWLMPAAHAQPLAKRKTKKPAYTLPVSKDLQMGRNEPFLPLADAKPVAKESLPAVPPLRIALMGLLVGGDDMPSALVQVESQRLRVRPGSILMNGAEVLAIGGNYLLVRYAGQIHRIGLAQDGEPQTIAPTPTPTASPSASPELPVQPPAIPKVPGLPGQ